MPRFFYIPLTLLGAGLLIAGGVRRQHEVDSVGETNLRKPTRVDGALMIGAGLPALTWGITDGLVWTIAGGMH